MDRFCIHFLRIIIRRSDMSSNKKQRTVRIIKRHLSDILSILLQIKSITNKKGGGGGSLAYVGDATFLSLTKSRISMSTIGTVDYP